jgi:lysylphosphatidylglycerol synthetase-like protein (DUF2156 family)
VQPNPHKSWILGLRDVKMGERSAPKFVHSSNYHKEDKAFKPTKIHYLSNPKPSFKPKRDVKKKPSNLERKLLLMIRLTLLLILCLISLMDLTIAHMVLVHQRTTLCLDILVMTHVLIVVIIFHVGLFFLLDGFTLTLSRDTWTVYIFPTMAHVPLSQMVRCKEL